MNITKRLDENQVALLNLYCGILNIYNHKTCSFTIEAELGVMHKFYTIYIEADPI